MPDPTPSRDNLADAQAAAGPCPHHAVAKAWPMMINTIARGFAYRESEIAERDARVKALEAEVLCLRRKLTPDAIDDDSLVPLQRARDEWVARAKALEAECERLREGERKGVSAHLSRCERDAKEIERLQVQLRKHGDHEASCPAGMFARAVAIGDPHAAQMRGSKCSPYCGWAAIEEGLDGD